MEFKRRIKNSIYDDKTTLEMVMFYNFLLNLRISISGLNRLKEQSIKTWRRYANDLEKLQFLPKLTIKTVDGEKYFVQEKDNEEEEWLFDKEPISDSDVSAHAKKLRRIAYLCMSLTEEGIILFAEDLEQEYEEDVFSAYEVYMDEYDVSDLTFIRDLEIALTALAYSHKQWKEVLEEYHRGNRKICKGIPEDEDDCK